MNTEKNPLNIIELMQRDNSVDAPAESIRWASNLFRTRAAQPKQSLVQRIAAVLQMEISPNKAAFGERSASASQVRQLLFHAGDNAIELRIEPGKNGFIVRGQVFGDGFAEATVSIVDDSRRFEGKASELSEFTIVDVPAGRYELLIEGNNIEISLKAVDIQ